MTRSPTRDRVNALQVYVNPLERSVIKETARSCSMTVSAYLRAAALGQRLKTTLDLDAVAALAAVAEQQRELTKKLSEGLRGDVVSALLTEIRTVQASLVEAASKIRT